MRKYIVDHTSTWKLLAIVSSLIAVIALGTFSFQKRQPIIQAITGNKLFMKPLKGFSEPSSGTKEELISFVNGNSLIVGVNITHADFAANTRQSLFHFTKVEEVNKVLDSSNEMAFPLFTDESYHNNRLVQLINGQFICAPTQGTISSITHPILNAHSKTICTVAVPPGFGDFVGWVNIFLQEEPTYSQMEKLRESAEKLARDIYERDVARRRN
jgi:hypothetical protein